MDWTPGSPVELTTGEYILKSIAPSDIDERYVGWWRDGQVMAGLPSPVSRLSLEQHRKRIANQFNNRNKFHLIIIDRENDLRIGFVAILIAPLHGVASVNIVVGDKSYWGRNILPAIGDALKEFIFETLDAAKISAHVVARNLPMVRSCKAVNLTVEGILKDEWRLANGKRADLLVFGLLRKDWLKQREESGK